MKAILFTDGGARGNPGPAGIGYVLTIDGGEKITFSEFVGKATNNQAEYLALLAGLNGALQNKVKTLDCFLDSELLVRQLKGEYRVKNEGLRGLYDEVRNKISNFSGVSFTHVRRDKNKEADKLVNEAIDAHNK